MHIWILLYALTNSHAAYSGTAEFSSQGACVMAAGELKRQPYGPDYAICVPKDG